MPTWPRTWPPLPLACDGRLPLTSTPTVEGPWTDQVRIGLAVLDPLPLAAGAPSDVHISTSSDPHLPPEGFSLSIHDAGIRIAAASARGALQAATTIRQLLPSEAWRTRATRRDDWILPITQVTDAPAFPYRGFMLDVARHFAEVPEVLRWLDLAAMHRLNHLHLHLTDDQGWRVECPSFPELGQSASWRPETWIGHGRAVEPHGRAAEPHHPEQFDGTPHGGCYSVADLREITEYARRLGITVVPELDLPGHASALLAAIPALGVPGCPAQSVATRWGLLGRTVSPLPAAMDLLSTLLGEVAGAVDSPYLHIGGDEADLTMWRNSPEIVAFAAAHGGVAGLRSTVNAGLARAVLGLGRRPIVWDDAFVAGGLPIEAIVMAWRSADLGGRAAAAGHDVVMTPVFPTYLDYAEDDGPLEPLSIGAPLPLDAVAAWVPTPVADPGAKGRILGGQGQLWTEYAPDRATREYRAFPRLAVLAANLWRGAPLGAGIQHSPAAGALADHLERLRAQHVNYRPLAGPHPWQRAGSGRRAPRAILDLADFAGFLDRTSGHAEPQ